MNKLKILVTGGTGFLGQKVVPLLREFHYVDVISRSNGDVKGDLTAWNAGLNIDKLKKEKYDIFLHMAGLYNLSASQVDCYQHNVAATNTALKISDLLGIPVFINTSSVAAGINSTLPSVKPYDLNFTRPFPDYYSESKALAEKLIQNWQGQHRLKINLRLGILVGDTQNGTILRIDGPYHTPVAFERMRSLIEKSPTKIILPGRSETRIPIIPVDITAKAIVEICNKSQDKNVNGYVSHHLTPNEGLPLLDLYTRTMKQLFIRNKGINLVGGLPNKLMTKLSHFLIGFPEEELRYVLLFPKYENTSTQELLGANWCPEFSNYDKAFWSGYEAYISNRRN